MAKNIGVKSNSHNKMYNDWHYIVNDSIAIAFLVVHTADHTVLAVLASRGSCIPPLSFFAKL